LAAFRPPIPEPMMTTRCWRAAGTGLAMMILRSWRIAVHHEATSDKFVAVASLPQVFLLTD
jgi:hypothetical protein